jgi:hypothetical protein
MPGLCGYKHIFGEPNTGLRRYRILDIAILDTVVVILFGIAISKLARTPLPQTLAFLFLLGILAHRLFCVRTGIDRMLFPDK